MWSWRTLQKTKTNSWSKKVQGNNRFGLTSKCIQLSCRFWVKWTIPGNKAFSSTEMSGWCSIWANWLRNGCATSLSLAISCALPELFEAASLISVSCHLFLLRSLFLGMSCSWHFRLTSYYFLMYFWWYPMVSLSLSLSFSLSCHFFAFYPSSPWQHLLLSALFNCMLSLCPILAHLPPNLCVFLLTLLAQVISPLDRSFSLWRLFPSWVVVSSSLLMKLVRKKTVPQATDVWLDGFHNRASEMVKNQW